MHLRGTKKNLIIVLALTIASISILAILSAQRERSSLPSTPVPASQLSETKANQEEHRVIGKSVEGRNIDAYIYGNGATHLLFVGGIHGGYEWNSVLLAYQFIDYLKENPDRVPKNLSIAIVPSANPDGLYRVIGKDGRFTIKEVPTVEQTDGTGRFNTHGVDLNRNFDCKWKPKSTWKNKIVSAGTSAFSEPETVAIRDFVKQFTPDSVVFWHSKANAVYASKCTGNILPKTLDIMNAYSRASGYTAIKSFDAYEVSGDAEGWLASINIPAITVELQTHETVEWQRNLAGIKAIFRYYAQ